MWTVFLVLAYFLRHSLAANGIPVERWGRKATGLTVIPTIAGLHNGVFAEDFSQAEVPGKANNIND